MRIIKPFVLFSLISIAAGYFFTPAYAVGSQGLKFFDVVSNSPHFTDAQCKQMYEKDVLVAQSYEHSARAETGDLKEFTDSMGDHNTLIQAVEKNNNGVYSRTLIYQSEGKRNGQPFKGKYFMHIVSLEPHSKHPLVRGVFAGPDCKGFLENIR